MKFNLSILFFFTSLFFNSFFAQKGYELRFYLNNYEGKSAKLGFHYGNKQYIKDSAKVDEKGWVTFKNETELEPGVYLFIMQPKNVYFEVLINRNEQHFTMESDVKDVATNMKVTGSPDNALYYEYLNQISEKRENLSNLKDALKTNPNDEAKKAEITKAEDELDAYQRLFIQKNATTFSGKIVKASRDIDIPKFDEKDPEFRNKRYFWYKAHFFDNYDMGDERMIRTPVMFNRVNYYIEKLSVQAPDSIIQAIENVIDMTKASPETFKFFVTHYLNFYAKSDIIGHDGIYVHLAKKYYETGKTPWVNADQLEKIIRQANELEPTLLGKQAKPLTVYTQDNKAINIYDIKADYTILMFWAPDCGHCKEEMPDVIKFYNKWKDKGVYFLGICNRIDSEKIPECWEFMKERPDMKFPVGTDTNLRSNSQSNYYVKSTPMVFILDKDKKIVMKKIKPAKLDEVLSELIAIETERKKLEMEKKK